MNRKRVLSRSSRDCIRLAEHLRPRDSLSSGSNTQLLKHVSYVNLRGGVRDEQGTRDLAVSHATRDEFQHFKLTRGEKFIRSQRGSRTEPSQTCQAPIIGVNVQILKLRA